MLQTSVILFGEEPVSKPFLTDYKKRQLRRFFGREHAAFIREITHPNFQDLPAYLEHVIRVQDDASLIVLEELAHQPVMHLKALVYALSRFTISYLNSFILRDKLAWKVRQLQAERNGKTLSHNSLLTAIYWGMLHAMATYNPNNGVAFSFCVFGAIQRFASLHIEDQTGIHLVGSFLGKASRKEYFEAKLRELITGIPQPNPYVEKLRAAFPESF